MKPSTALLALAVCSCATTAPAPAPSDGETPEHRAWREKNERMREDVRAQIRDADARREAREKESAEKAEREMREAYAGARARAGLRNEETEVAAKEFREAVKLLAKSREAGFLYDLKWDPPREPRVLVGLNFLAAPIDIKEDIAVTIARYLMAGERTPVDFDVLDWRTGNPIGRYAGGRLAMK